MIRLNIRLYAAVAAGAILLLYLFSGLTTIQPGEVGVLLKQYGADRGMQKETLSGGTHWVEPFLYDVTVYDTRLTQREVTQLPSGTSDGQPVLIDVSFQVGLVSDSVPGLHQNVGREWWEQIVLPLVRSTVRNEAAKVASDVIYTGEGRDSIQVAVSNSLQAKLESFGIRIETNLRDISFQNKEYVNILEEKAAAEQLKSINSRKADAAVEEARRIENVANGQRLSVQQAAQAEREKRRLEGEGERLQKEEQAKGILAIATAEAEGTRLRNAALSGPGGERIVQMEWARNLAPKLTVWGLPVTEKSNTIVMDAMRGVSINAGDGK